MFLAMVIPLRRSLGVFAILILLLSSPVSADALYQTEWDVRPDPTGLESLLVVPELSRGSVHYSMPEQGPFREVEEMRDDALVYRIDTRTYKSARVQFRLANQFLVSVSTDTRTWKPILKFPEGVSNTHLANLDWYSADLTPFLPAEAVYLKIEDGDKASTGFGPLVFGMRLQVDHSRLHQPMISAVRTRTAPVIDGDLSDAVWIQAGAAETFGVIRGDHPPGEATALRTLWDEQGLYVAVRCADTQAERLPAIATAHPSHGKDAGVYHDDCVELFFDVKLDRKHYIHLAANVLGARYDERDKPSTPGSFDGKWTVATKIDPAGWSAEFFIPWQDLQIDPAIHQILGFNLGRTHASERSTLSLVEENWHEPDRFGLLQLGDEPGVSVNFLSQPVTAGSNTFTAQVFNHGEHAFAGSLYFSATVNDQTAAQVVQNVELTAGAHGEIAIPFNIEDSGVVTVSVHVIDQGMIGNGAIQQQRLRAEQFVAFDVISRQPFYRREPAAVFDINLRMAADQLKQQQATVLLRDSTGNVVYQSQLVPRLGHQRIEIPITSIPQGIYNAAISLDSDGTAVASRTFTIEKLPPIDGSPIRSTADAHGNFYINGNKIFIRMFALANPQQLDGLIQFGGNAAITHGPHALDDVRSDRDKWLREMTAAVEPFYPNQPVYTAPHLCGLLRGGADFESLRAVVSYLKDQPSIFVWYLADEPNGWNTHPEDLLEAKRIINEIDPDHLVIVLDSAPSAYAVWSQGGDIFSGDPYPLLGESPLPLRMVGDWTRAALASVKPGTPVWMCIQTAGKPWFHHYPSPSELRNMFYQAIVNGSRGMIYWQMEATIREGDASTFQQLARESDHLMPLLMDETPSVATTHKAGDAEINVLTKLAGNVGMMIAVNVTDEPGEILLPIPAGYAVKPLFGDKAFPTSGGQLRQSFEPYGVHLYQLDR